MIIYKNHYTLTCRIEFVCYFFVFSFKTFDENKLNGKIDKFTFLRIIHIICKLFDYIKTQKSKPRKTWTFKQEIGLHAVKMFQHSEQK